MPPIEFTSEFIVLTAGVIVSLLASYVPKFNAWFAALSKEVKQLSMLLIMLIVTVVVFVLGCVGAVQIKGFVCEQASAVQFVYLLILAIMVKKMY